MNTSFVVSTNPAVSVVMSAYNEQEYIRQAIESVIGQQYTNWEFIIIDDCSTDNTSEIIHEYAEYDKRLMVLYNTENLGLAASLNKGIGIAKGHYIARMDADDISKPERLDLQVKFLDSHPEISVLGTGAVYVDENRKPLSRVYMPESHNEIINNIFRNSPFIHPSVMIRRSYFDVTNGYLETMKRAQDYELWLRGIGTGEYHNLQNILIEYMDKEKRSLRSLYDSSIVRFKHANNLIQRYKIILRLVVEILSRVKRFGKNAFQK